MERPLTERFLRVCPLDLTPLSWLEKPLLNGWVQELPMCPQCRRAQPEWLIWDSVEQKLVWEGGVLLRGSIQDPFQAAVQDQDPATTESKDAMLPALDPVDSKQLAN